MKLSVYAMRRTRLDHKSCGKGHNQLFILVFDLNTRLNRAEICGIYGRRFLDEIDLCLHLILVLAQGRLQARHDTAVRLVASRLNLLQLLHLRRSVGVELLLQI